MENFGEFKFNWTYHVAANVRNQIFREDPEHLSIDIDGYFLIDDDFIKKSLKPNKYTFLHQFIEDSLYADIEYISRKSGDHFLPEWLRLLDGYNIPYEDEEDFDSFDEFEPDDDYESYILEKVTTEILHKIVNEVFTLLFSDRAILLEMNKVISGTVINAKKSDFPTLLNCDGKINRCTYWPSWVKNALVYRDKARCSICLCDLSGTIVSGKNYAIDHIIPLNLGGTNDPTNLQLLCNNCNSSKSGDKITTSHKYHFFWEPVK